MKTLKKSLFLVLFLFAVTTLMAQNNTQDVVYLKNGGITRGTILEFFPEKHIKIQTVDGNVFVYQMSEIEKYAKELVYNSKTHLSEDNTGVKKGYYGVIEFGPGYSFHYLQGPLTARLNVINGYRINPWFAAGAGFGLRLYTEEGLMFPFFADLRTNFLNQRLSPYLSLEVGYAFFAENTERGGLLLNPVFGVSVKLRNRSTINLGLSYEAQGVKNVYHYYDDYYYSANNINKKSFYGHTISFQLGFGF
jgi:hypothetical protein